MRWRLVYILPILKSSFLILIDELKSSILLRGEGEQVFSQVGLFDSDLLGLSMIFFPELINDFSIILDFLRTDTISAISHIYFFLHQLRHLLSRLRELLRLKVVMALSEQNVAEVAGFVHSSNYSKMEQYYQYQ